MISYEETTDPYLSLQCAPRSPQFASFQLCEIDVIPVGTSETAQGGSAAWSGAGEDGSYDSVGDFTGQVHTKPTGSGVESSLPFCR